MSTSEALKDTGNDFFSPAQVAESTGLGYQPLVRFR